MERARSRIRDRHLQKSFSAICRYSRQPIARIAASYHLPVFAINARCRGALLNPPTCVVVASREEPMPGLGTTQPCCRWMVRRGRHARLQRHGTTTLFAALDVLQRSTPHLKAPIATRISELLREIDGRAGASRIHARRYYSPHKHPRVRHAGCANALAAAFHSTYSSWLNWSRLLRTHHAAIAGSFRL